MTAGNPKAPFTVGRDDCSSWVSESGNGETVGIFYGPDRQARAEALAAEYEQTYGPEWVVGKDYAYLYPTLLNRRTGARITGHEGWGWDDMVILCRLLNEHGGLQ